MVKRIKLVMRNPCILLKNLEMCSDRLKFDPQADFSAPKYLRSPATPVRSLVNFLMRLALDVGKAFVKPMSGSLSVSVYL